MPIPLGSRPVRLFHRTCVLGNGSPGRTLIRKTSLLRIVPTACGQAADIALAREPAAPRFSSQCNAITFNARRLRIGRDVTSRSNLGAILPLHDVRYHAPAGSLAASCRARKTFSANEPEVPSWWSQTGSNRRPPACKAGALPTELWPRPGEQQSEVGNQTGASVPDH
jgi:hypothetical protein